VERCDDQNNILMLVVDASWCSNAFIVFKISGGASKILADIGQFFTES